MLICEGRQVSVKKNIKSLEALVQLFWQTEDRIGYRLMGTLAASI